MGIPANKTAATQDENLDGAELEQLENNTIEHHEDDEDDVEAIKKFEATVSEAVKNIKRDEKTGKYLFPKGIAPEVKHAAILEQRRRDTQSGFTKASQKIKALEAGTTALKRKALSEVKLNLTAEQEEELEDLKFSDTDAWRKKVNKYEREAYAKHQTELDEELGKVSTDILEKDELERRKDVLEEFNQAHPDFVLDDEVIANEIPPRIAKRLETGEISFEAFLQECYDYSKTGKVVKDTKVPGQPNMSRMGGGTKPDKNAETMDITLSYNKEVF